MNGSGALRECLFHLIFGMSQFVCYKMKYRILKRFTLCSKGGANV